MQVYKALDNHFQLFNGFVQLYNHVDKDKINLDRRERMLSNFYFSFIMYLLMSAA